MKSVAAPVKSDGPVLPRAPRGMLVLRRVWRAAAALGIAGAWLLSPPLSATQPSATGTTFDSPPALEAVRATGPPSSGTTLERRLADHKIPVGETVAVMIEYVKAHGRPFFDAVSALIRGSVDGLTAVLRAIPFPLLILGAALLGWVLRRSWALALFVALALLFIMNQGYWEPTLETLSLVIVAAVVSGLIGVPLGIAAAHRPRLYATLRPVLDLMQTLPTFVYLIPTLVLFGLGVVPGLISTVIFALPAPIRLTQLGISSVPKPLLEAGEAFGATPLQLLFKVELPSAAPTILAGITQCIMLSLSMVVIAALVGAGGLGVPVVRALNTVQVGMGFEAGIVIVLLAIVLDRISRPADEGSALHDRDCARVPCRGYPVLRRARAACPPRGHPAGAGAAGCRCAPAAEIAEKTGRRRRGGQGLAPRGARGDLGPHGPVRLGQVDAAARRQRPQSRHPRPGAGRLTATRTVDIGVNCDPATLRRIRRARIAMVFQQFGAAAVAHGARQRRLRPGAARRSAREAHARSSTGSWSWSACRSGRIATPANCPAACSSASAWRAPLPPMPTSC